MTMWKIELTYLGKSPAGTDLKHRLVVDAERADDAIAGAKNRLGLDGPVTTAFQAFDAVERADPEAAANWFVETGDFRPRHIAERV